MPIPDYKCTDYAYNILFGTRMTAADVGGQSAILYASNYTYAENSTSAGVSMPDDCQRVQVTRCHSDGSGRSCSRTVFTRAQLDAMEERFLRQSFLTREERIELAEQIQVTERQILVWFQNRRGRLKRKGPADKAYKRKQFYCTEVGPDGRGRAFLAGIAWAKQTAGSVDFSEKTRGKTDNVSGGFVQPHDGDISMTWKEILKEKSGKVLDDSHATIADYRLHDFQNHSINIDAINSDNGSDNIQQAQFEVSRSYADNDFLQLGSSAQQLPFYQSQSFQNSGNETVAWERQTAQWNAVDQLHHTEQHVTNCGSRVDETCRNFHTTSTSFWLEGSQTNQEELYLNSSYSYFSTPLDMPVSMWPCISSNEFETATGNWFSTNSNSVDQFGYQAYRQAIVDRETY